MFTMDGFLAAVWSVVGWITFCFKLASLAFAVPWIVLMILDFFLWLWRLNRPPPRESRTSSPATKRHRPKSLTQPNSPVASSSALASNDVLDNNDRRETYATPDL
ncbi:hypothetical protein GGR57DRAFT_164380 [Xylariaceae sp. FL1272]|nr:hypothetical protein GGR57DRAFT_164380 [Xylariaceae sp. FL1272]